LAFLGACSNADLLLSAQARQDLVDNFEASVEAQQTVSEYVFAASRGDLDLAGAQYTPPVGSTPGTLTIQNGVFPFGTGDLTIVFTAEGDNGFVDPYVVDLTTHQSVTVVADVLFTGISTTGEALDVAADFTATTLQNGLDDVQAVINGDFAIGHGPYDIDFTATDVEMGLDLLNETVTNVVGNVEGTVDIPDFAYDAAFTVNGLGDQIQIDIDAVVTSIVYTLALDQL